jgi:hypothetical protein
VLVIKFRFNLTLRQNSGLSQEFTTFNGSVKEAPPNIVTSGIWTSSQSACLGL